MKLIILNSFIFFKYLNQNSKFTNHWCPMSKQLKTAFYMDALIVIRSVQNYIQLISLGIGTPYFKH